MANEPKKLTHKVRNPNNMSTWLDIWSAEVSATGDSYVITPSTNWKIPLSNVIFDTTNGKKTNFLNEKGSWSTLPTTGLVTFSENNNDNTIAIDIVTNSNTSKGVVAKPGDNNTDANKIWATDNSSNPSWNQVATDMIEDQAITHDKVAQNAIESENIVNNTIVNDDINTNANINGSKLADGTISKAKLSSSVQSQLDTKLLGLTISTIQPENVDVDSITSFYDLNRRIQNRHLFPYLTATQIIEANHGNPNNPQETEVTVCIYINSGDHGAATITSTNLSGNNIYKVGTLYVFSNDLSTIFSPQHLLSEFLLAAQDAYNNTSTIDFYSTNSSVLNSICLDMQPHFNRRMQYIDIYAEEDKINAQEIASQCTSDLSNNLFNNWDYEHLGLWIQV